MVDGCKSGWPVVRFGVHPWYFSFATNRSNLMKKSYLILAAASALFLIPSQSIAQGTSRLYVNAGYITNFEKCAECTKKDEGGSVRLGILTDGKWGFYAGYLWFTEYNAPYIGYDDEGAGFVGGFDFRLLKHNQLRIYVKTGLFLEKFTSTYPDRSETETSPKPDLGLFFNLDHVNAYAGWQPSEPPHINVGIGFTL